MSVTPALGRLRQGDCHELQSSLNYIARFCLKVREGRGGGEREEESMEGKEKPRTNCSWNCEFLVLLSSWLQPGLPTLLKPQLERHRNVRNGGIKVLE